jgi:hypothetical protein
MGRGIETGIVIGSPGCGYSTGQQQKQKKEKPRGPHGTPIMNIQGLGML